MDTVETTQTDLYSTQSKGRKLAILVILAVLFSAMGWAAETVLFYISRGRFVDRGLLTLPVCPMYGLSALLIYALLRTPCSGVWIRLTRAPKTRTGRFAAVLLCILLYVAAAAFLASLVEYITGAFYHGKFGVRLWNYRNDENNIDGFVCLKYSLLWGALAVSAMGLIWYPLQNVLARAKTAALTVSAVVLFVGVSADFVFHMVYLFLHGSRFLLSGRVLRFLYETAHLMCSV